MNPSYLLDTCALLAIQDGGTAFSKKVRSLLEAPGSIVMVSAISAFEIGQKIASGKLALPCTLGHWFQSMLRQHALTEIQITSSICIAAAALPVRHKDPFDRMIIATAMEHRLPIITSDKIIPTYSKIKTLW